MPKNKTPINSIESNIESKKSNKFVENTKRAIRKLLTTTGITAGSMGPVTTPCLVPASLNTITRIAPIASTAIKTISLGTAVVLFSSFDKEHKSIEINNIRPVDILPIIGQVEAGDKQVYEHIEHLRIAEATRIRDMMWNYGAGNHSAEEYQTLMNRLHTGMTMENPKGYNNYETIGGEVADEPSNHAHDERDILNTLINHANFNVVNPNNSRRTKLYEFVKSNPDKICIFGNSASAEVDKSTYLNWGNDDIKNLCKSKNFLLFAAGGNIKTKNGKPINKIYHEDIDGDESGKYSLPSSANGKNDSHPNRHLIVTIGTNAKGDIDQTNEKYSSSKFPVGFHNDVLFAGREFPSKSIDGTIEATPGKYPTSYVTYTNVAIADLCFQMFAEVKDIDELLEMIRSSSDLRDYIRFDINGDGDTNDTHDSQQETQPLILMNPAGFFQKYLMPTTLPTNVRADETVDLEKGYYHGIIYKIPGAEVNINDQWIDFSDDNKNLILAQNPMTLKWRINGELLNKYNYKPGDTINGQIVVVDDMWNGLNLTKNFSITIEEANGINTTNITTPNVSDIRYTVDGIRLNAKPKKPGIYIVNKQKVIIK